MATVIVSSGRKLSSVHICCANPHHQRTRSPAAVASGGVGPTWKRRGGLAASRLRQADAPERRGSDRSPQEGGQVIDRGRVGRHGLRGGERQAGRHAVSELGAPHR